MGSLHKLAETISNMQGIALDSAALRDSLNVISPPGWESANTVLPGV